MDYKLMTLKVIDLAKIAGTFILEQRKLFTPDRIEKKGKQDFVSYVDKETEKMLVDGLRTIIPVSGFIVEEKTANHTNEEFIWVVDPLDGTTNFIHGITPFAISIALMQNSKTVVGVIYELGQKEIFYSWKGAGVYCNENQVTVSKAKAISEGLIATGFHINDNSRLEGQLQTVFEIVSNSHGIRRPGSAATDLAYVAAGRFDGFFEFGLSPWDVAAGAFLVEQAGGKVSDYSGGQNYMNGREIIAGTPGVYQNLLQLIQKNANQDVIN
jgi:myo-inositol-1(or 4)-monophosphatase